MIGRKTILTAFLVILALQAIPLAAGWLAAGNEHVFTGLAINPMDGNTYLAKMRLGWEGGWQFSLPYSPEQSNGAYLFLFYVFLGHVARWLSLPLIAVFHIARGLAGLALVVSLARFCEAALADRPAAIPRAFWLAVLGSGLGWLAAMTTGTLTADFWVAETYPFLSMAANPHFPLGLALLLALLTRYITTTRWSVVDFAIAAVGGAFLAVIQPFGVVVLAVILGGEWGWKCLAQKRLEWPWKQAALLASGGAVLLAQYAAILSDPILAEWNRQNLTPAPAIWDFVLSLSPALLAAVWGGWRMARGSTTTAGSRILTVWLIAGCILVYLPFGLQRRFMSGLFVPAALLAAWALTQAKGFVPRRAAFGAVFALSLPTLLLLWFSTVLGMGQHPDLLFLTRGEADAMEVLSVQTPNRSLVIAAPETGLFLPPRSGMRVLYGHPFESVDAERRKADLERFFAGKISLADLPFIQNETESVYLWIGPREKRLGAGDFSPPGDLVFTNEDVSVYRIEAAK